MCKSLSCKTTVSLPTIEQGHTRLLGRRLLALLSATKKTQELSLKTSGGRVRKAKKKGIKFYEAKSSFPVVHWRLSKHEIIRQKTQLFESFKNVDFLSVRFTSFSAVISLTFICRTRFKIETHPQLFSSQSSKVFQNSKSLTEFSKKHVLK